jgi:hypothetical protein
MTAVYRRPSRESEIDLNRLTPMIYLDELIAEHRKILRAGTLIGDAQGGAMAALGLYVAAIGYARKHLTDGVVPDEFLQKVSRNERAILSLGRAKLIKKLRGNSWRIHDYLDWNKSAAEVLAERQVTRKRQKRFRDKQPVENSHVTPLRTGEVTVLSRLRNGGSPIPDPRSPIPDPQDRSTSTVPDQVGGEGVRKDDWNSGSAAPDTRATHTPSSSQAKRLAKAPAADGNFAVLERLAHTVLEEIGADDPESPDVVEAFKTRCAALSIHYHTDPHIARRALVSAATQRLLIPVTRGDKGSVAAMATKLLKARTPAAMGHQLKALAARGRR